MSPGLDQDTLELLELSQAQRVECLRFASELATAVTFVQLWDLARWLYEGSSS